MASPVQRFQLPVVPGLVSFGLWWPTLHFRSVRQRKSFYLVAARKQDEEEGGVKEPVLTKPAVAWLPSTRPQSGEVSQPSCTQRPDLCPSHHSLLTLQRKEKPECTGKVRASLFCFLDF